MSPARRYSDLEFTISLPVGLIDITFTVSGTYYPGLRGRLYGRPEDCYPAEPPSFSLGSISPPIPADEDEEQIEQMLAERALEYCSEN